MRQRKKKKVEMNKDVFLWFVPLPLVHFPFIVDNLKGQFTSSLVTTLVKFSSSTEQFQSFTGKKDSIQLYAHIGHDLKQAYINEKKQVSITLMWCHVSVGKTL